MKIEELKKIKELCFDKIYAKALDKADLCVEFNNLKNGFYQIVMSNRVDYAQLICDNKEDYPSFKIQWNDFEKIVQFFESGEIKLFFENQNIVVFRQRKNIFKCLQINTPAPHHQFKFDFEHAQLLSMDDCTILKDHKDLQKFILNQNNLISSDGFVCIVNTLNTDIGDNILHFLEPFPKGKWFFNIQNNIIVSEDKTISCSYRLATGQYPLSALRQIMNQYLNNCFECDSKVFKAALVKCSLADNGYRVKINFLSESIKINTFEDKKAACECEITGKYLSPPKRKFLYFGRAYLKILLEAQTNGVVKLQFSDTESIYAMRAQNDKKNILAIGCII